MNGSGAAAYSQVADIVVPSLLREFPDFVAVAVEWIQSSREGSAVGRRHTASTGIVKVKKGWLPIISANILRTSCWLLESSGFQILELEMFPATLVMDNEINSELNRIRP